MVTASDLAREHGVSKNVIGLILKGRTRKGAGGPITPIRPICGERARGFRTKLTEPVVRDIRRRYAQGGETIFTLADRFGISNQMVSDLIRGNAWKHVPMPDGLRVRPSHTKLSAEQVDALRRDAAGHPSATHEWLAQRHGVSRAAVSLILQGKHHGANPYGYVARRSPQRKE